MTRRRGLRALPLLALLAIAIQFFPARIRERDPDPAHFIESLRPVSGEIGGLLRRSCYDCHGGPTRMPWYGRVAPASWLVAYDVNESMEYLDFSRWGRLDARRRAGLLEEMAETVRSGAMPLRRYLWLHGEARLSPEERDRLAQWAESEAERLSSLGGGARPRGRPQADGEEAGARGN